jgi:hypothetical protein
METEPQEEMCFLRFALCLFALGQNRLHYRDVYLIEYEIGPLYSNVGMGIISSIVSQYML